MPSEDARTHQNEPIKERLLAAAFLEPSRTAWNAPPGADENEGATSGSGTTPEKPTARPAEARATPTATGQLAADRETRRRRDV